MCNYLRSFDSYQYQFKCKLLVHSSTFFRVFHEQHKVDSDDNFGIKGFPS